MIIKIDLLLKDFWINTLYEIIKYPSDSTQFAGIKYIKNYHCIYPGSVFTGEAGFNLEELGYSGRDSKMKQLTRIYFDPISVKNANDKINGRKNKDFTSVVVNTMAGQKSSNSQGHCIIGIVITVDGKNNFTRVCVMYRMTEAIRKFGADLLFFKEILLPKILGPKIDNLHSVSFHFANLAFSPMFFPAILDKVILEEFLFEARENPKTQKEIIAGLRRSLEHEPGYYSFRSRNNMHILAHEKFKNPLIKQEVWEIIHNDKFNKKV